jgi:hypothetical protein
MKSLVPCLSLAVFCLLATATYSQTTFTGANSDYWADAGNWDNGVPAAGNDATIPGGLYVSNTGIVIVDFNIENNGYITNQGTIETIVGVTITNSGTIHNDVQGVITNSGTINNEGYFENNATNALGLLGFFNYGTINNYENINMLYSGIMLFAGFNHNDGIINNNGYIEVQNGDLYNLGTIDNYDHIEVWGGLIYNYNDGTINQCGTWYGMNSTPIPYSTANCPVVGCTDTTACNYVPDAIEDDDSCIYVVDGACDCDFGLTYVTVGGGAYDSEISWSITDSNGDVVAEGGAPEEQEVCLNPASCYTLNMLDSYGDGWNGATADIDMFGSFTLAEGSEGSEQIGDCGGGDCDGNVEDALGICGGDCLSDYNSNGICDDEDVVGCTYEEALNYGSTATIDDGTCVFPDITSNDQAVYDGAFADGVNSVDITSDNQAAFDAGVASVECPENNQGDLNGDLTVDVNDLLIFLGAYGMNY